MNGKGLIIANKGDTGSLSRLLNDWKKPYRRFTVPSWCGNLMTTIMSYDRLGQGAISPFRDIYIAIVRNGSLILRAPRAPKGSK